ncbi:Mov34/MPN/PAD-1 family protein [Serratia surfactantfaciens]|uniref:Mov34/MPN/PAD-1 family protein n=1 Tax=Serratia surfactantfaciens TaxID=2741499 RepID=UPI0018E4D8A3|nr:Mov34/MPN/PAD-1 family protein [Serratia surfactantfaciens]MBI6152194.1 Mov34/MPN/PAD-1 family protein [Serratia surfactantfaciens]
MTSIAWRWKWGSGDVELLVSQAVADVLGSYRQRWWGAERGGQLFVASDCPDGLLLALATLPHSSDRAGRTWLELNDQRCLNEINRANTTGLRLVGYWHTHPQKIPEISSADIDSFSRFAARYTKELPHPLAVIVGQSSQSAGIKAWSFRGGQYVEATRLE